METFEQKLQRVISEKVDISHYDPQWPVLFENEKKHLLSCLPQGLITRIEHFGSTAVPGLCAKPIVDLLVEVKSLEETKQKVAPILESQGYDYFWRPSFGDDVPPFYAFFIKRDAQGQRTHHIHMIEADFEHWDKLFFRDYLREFSDVAGEYQKIKMELSEKFHGDRIKYTNAKTDFIVRITKIAKEYYLRNGK
jgi:GrpB-like predicted nucleotidyltransferase (UPF0157 family)